MIISLGAGRTIQAESVHWGETGFKFTCDHPDLDSKVLELIGPDAQKLLADNGFVIVKMYSESPKNEPR